jgi:hypothetical protein
MRPGTTLSVYTTSWSLSTLSTHKTMDHSVCLYITMVSSHQFSAWDHRVVSVLMYGIGEKRPWCCIDRWSGHWSHVWDWWEETMVLYRQSGPWSMVSYQPFYTWDQGPLYLSIQHHGLLSTIPYMRPRTTLSVYKTPWSLLTNSIHETRDHSICLYNIMVSMLYRQIEWSMVSWIE